mgnify:CR=1 FL=1
MRLIASTIRDLTQERTGRLAAQLTGWSGVRILQDNVLWKPPGTKAIGFHQDGSYADYLVPPEMVTCWMSLHETQADAGPIAYVRGSNHWPWTPPERSQFHAPEDWLAGVRDVATGHDEDVRGRLRIDVLEGDDVVVFVDLRAGNLSGDDAAEQTVGHRNL